MLPHYSQFGREMPLYPAAHPHQPITRKYTPRGGHTFFFTSATIYIQEEYTVHVLVAK